MVDFAGFKPWNTLLPEFAKTCQQYFVDNQRSRSPLGHIGRCGGPLPRPVITGDPRVTTLMVTHLAKILRRGKHFYGLGAGVGRGLGDGAERGVGVALGVDVAVEVGVGVAVAVGVGVKEAVGDAVAVGVPVGVGDEHTPSPLTVTV